MSRNHTPDITRALATDRKRLAQTLPTECLRCGGVVTPDMAWEVDHEPALSIDPANAQPYVSHKRCNRIHGGRLTRLVDTRRNRTTNDEAIANEIVYKTNTPLQNNVTDITPFSGAVGSRVLRTHDGISLLGKPTLSNPDRPDNPPISHDWSDSNTGHFLSIPPRPDSARWPRFMTNRHPNATGSYGPHFLEWTRDRFGMHPKRTSEHRWWQVLVASRALEHDAAGRLCWETVVLSTPRQTGKSWLVRELCLWRLSLGDQLGEVQTVVHTAQALKQAEAIWSPASRWCNARPEYVVRYQSGGEKIIGNDGSVWLIQAANDSLGVSLSVSLAVVDEAWSIDRNLIDNNLSPTMAEAEQPQLWVISTAGVPRNNERVTDLVPTYRDAAMDRDQSSVLFIEWSADGSADTNDPEVWRDASAYWDDRRVSRLRAARDIARTPQQVEAFQRQWLNVWPLGVVDRVTWGARVRQSLGAPDDGHVWVGPLVLAVESDRDGDQWGVAASDGVHVRAVSFREPVAAFRWLVKYAGAGASEVLCSETVARLLPRFVTEVVPVSPVTVSASRAATACFRDAVFLGGVSWSGVLGDQLSVAEVGGGSGLEYVDPVKSLGSVSALRAGLWVYWRATLAPQAVAAIW